MKKFLLFNICICLLAMLIACGRQTPNEDSVPTEVGASGAPTTVTGTESSAPTRVTEPTTGAQENTPTIPTGSSEPTEQSRPTEVTTAPTKAPLVTNPTEVTDPTVATQPDPVVPETTVPEIEEDGYNSQIIRP